MNHPVVYAISAVMAVGIGIWAYFAATSERRQNYSYSSQPSNKSDYVDSSSDCSICREDIQNDFVKTYLECGHAFHTKCINQWKQQNPLCPLCRNRIIQKR